MSQAGSLRCDTLKDVVHEGVHDAHGLLIQPHVHILPLKEKHGFFTSGVLGDGLGALGHGVLGQFPGQQQAHGGLDLPGGDGGPFVVVSQAGSLRGDALEDVVHEGVHDAHGLGGNAGIGMDLLQHLVHVDGVALLPGLSLLLAPFAGGFGHGFLGALLGR
ncbi:unnamed protein product [Menidia menidia]|uniref:(Atlantic silverside) hypothetical protein n=1 Tax=Menidia menidia TaxID=238744 RepID=A0A8S4BSX4_9TELE|nr:unnamed protein product [Menidia menidia]